MPSIYDSIVELTQRGEPFALGIITGIKGSSPQKMGAKALFFSTGRIVGTMGGGCLEAEIRRRAAEVLGSGKPQTFDLLLDHDFGWDDGLICGGKVKGVIIPVSSESEPVWRELAKRDSVRTWGVNRQFEIGWIKDDGRADAGEWLYRETVLPPCHLWIAGSGHIARAVAPLALKLDFAVSVFDDRPALASPEFFPPAIRLRVDFWEKLLGDELTPTPTFGLIVTRGHQHDALVLKDWITKPFSFLGMIGSRRKKEIIFSHFIEEGIATRERLAEVACPVGIDIDAVSVDEIAVSIMAQYIEKRAELKTRPEGGYQKAAKVLA